MGKAIEGTTDSSSGFVILEQALPLIRGSILSACEQTASGLDSRLRGNDGEVHENDNPGFVILGQALALIRGSILSACEQTASGLDSRLRGNDGEEREDLSTDATTQWPAASFFAKLTFWVASVRRDGAQDRSVLSVREDLSTDATTQWSAASFFAKLTFWVASVRRDGAQDRSVLSVREDLSTDATTQWSAEISLQYISDRSILSCLYLYLLAPFPRGG